MIDPHGLHKFSFSDTLEVLMNTCIHVEIREENSDEAITRKVNVIEHLNLVEN